MKVITAPESLYKGEMPKVFLAGGITNCPWWQNDVIAMLTNYEGVLYNPRRKNFPIENPNAAKEQIEWEFHALNNSDIFSIWFSNAESDQPICMYELGRHVARLSENINKIVIGIEPGYKREQDVRIQMELVDPSISNKISDTLEKHAVNIANAIEKL